MFKAILATLLICTASQAAGLKAGNNFESTRLLGDIRVRCGHGSESKVVNLRCDEDILAPTYYSKFVTQADADKVKLTYIDSRGKKRSKSSRIKDGQSKRSFNLWIWTLTQRPLLDIGENIISYKLTKKGKNVDSGDFTVNVDEMPARDCGYGNYYYSSVNACDSYTNLCRTHFQRNNYCR